MKLHLVALFIVLFACSASLGRGQSSSTIAQSASNAAESEQLQPYHLIRTIPLPFLKRMSGQLGFDVDSGRLFFSDGKNLVIVNTSDGARVGLIPKIRTLSDIAFAPEIHRAFIVDFDARDLIVLDLTTLAIVQKTNSGDESSSVFYDTATKNVFTTSITSSTCRVFDAISGKRVGAVKLRGSLLRAVGDSNGRIYFALISKGLETGPVPPKVKFTELDTRTLVVRDHWEEDATPSIRLMGVDRSGQNLVIGSKGSITLINPQTRTIVASSTVDADKWNTPVTFSSALGDAFFLGLDEQTDPHRLELIVVHEGQSGEFGPAELVPQASGRPIAFDGTTQRFFVLQSDTKTVDTALSITLPGSRPMPLRMPERIPGTFRILVYGRD